MQNRFLEENAIDLKNEPGGAGNASPQLTVDTNQLLALRIFWLGFILYAIGTTLTTTLVAKYHTNFSILQLIQIVAILLFLPSGAYIIKFRFENKYLKVIYLTFICWTVLVIARGFNLNIEFIKDLLFNGPFGIFPYILPLVLLFPQNLMFYKQLFNVIFILAILYILFDLAFIQDLLNRDVYNSASQTSVDYFSKNLAIPCGFLLLTYKYHSKYKKLFVVAVVLLSVFFVIIRARRALIFVLSAPLIINYIVYLFTSKSKFAVIGLSIIVGSFLSIYLIKQFNEGSMFNSVKERGTVDSRSPVEDCFYSDMKVNDLIFGRGINGEYYCPNIDESLTIDYRSIIETDYLNVILKSGIIGLGLMLLMAIPAMIKGFFYSKNLLSKAAALWILLYLCCLYPFNVTTFTMSYLMVWICIGLCFNDRIRNIPDEIMTPFLLNIKV